MPAKSQKSRDSFASEDREVAAAARGRQSFHTAGSGIMAAAFRESSRAPSEASSCPSSMHTDATAESSDSARPNARVSFKEPAAKAKAQAKPKVAQEDSKASGSEDEGNSGKKKKAKKPKKENPWETVRNAVETQKAAMAEAGAMLNTGSVEGRVFDILQGDKEKMHDAIYCAFQTKVTSLPRVKFVSRVVCQNLEVLSDEEQRQIRDLLHKFVCAIVAAAFDMIGSSADDQEKALAMQRELEEERQSINLMKANCLREVSNMRDQTYQDRCMEMEVNDVQLWEPLANVDAATKAIVLACVEEKLKDTSSRTATSKRTLASAEADIDQTKAAIRAAWSERAELLKAAEAEREEQLRLLEEMKREAGDAQFERNRLEKRASQSGGSQSPSQSPSPREGKRQSGKAAKTSTPKQSRRPSDMMPATSDFTEDIMKEFRKEPSNEKRHAPANAPITASALASSDLQGLLPVMTSTDRDCAERASVESDDSFDSFGRLATFGVTDSELGLDSSRKYQSPNPITQRTFDPRKEWNYMKQRCTTPRERAAVSYRASDIPFTEFTLMRHDEGDRREHMKSPQHPHRRPVLSSGKSGIGWRKAECKEEKTVLAVGSAIDKILAEQRLAELEQQPNISRRAITSPSTFSRRATSSRSPDHSPFQRHELSVERCHSSLDRYQSSVERQPSVERCQSSVDRCQSSLDSERAMTPRNFSIDCDHNFRAMTPRAMTPRAMTPGLSPKQKHFQSRKAWRLITPVVL